MNRLPSTVSLLQKDMVLFLGRTWVTDQHGVWPLGLWNAVYSIHSRKPHTDLCLQRGVQRFNYFFGSSTICLSLTRSFFRQKKNAVYDPAKAAAQWGWQQARNSKPCPQACTRPECPLMESSSLCAPCKRSRPEELSEAMATDSCWWVVVLS